ncbi:putative L-ribulose-5-phosphate 4-epimerase [Clostridiales bacterium 1_7_47FAA]|uniref:Class II aldolase/adducin family protein n=1 Tax=Enterocloster hominis (ex Hitch et al. 2024) TaxID=1917870 RepID=A0ABV1D5T4_9FIRM|nr:putative L-ribulose-5-phosphate 4-epimerase [Clostridiales bacterium 1_7_47FAA]
MLLKELREEVVRTGLRIAGSGLVQSTQGNISIVDRKQGLMAITPSGMNYDELSAADIVVTDLFGNIEDGERNPSTELPVHAYILRERDDINAIVHTHSPYATAMTLVNQEIPPVMIQLGEAVGGNVPIAPYTTGGQEKLGIVALDTMKDKNAVLLKNHGVIAVGPTLKRALFVAEMVEDTAKVYWIAKCMNMGEPESLSDETAAGVLERYKVRYGQKEG